MYRTNRANASEDMKPGLQSVQLFLSVLAFLQKISTAQNGKHVVKTYHQSHSTCPLPECVNDDVRLTSRSTPSQGIVEVCVRNTWINVCGVGWGSADAAVVCRQLGYLEGKQLTGVALAYYPVNRVYKWNSTSVSAWKFY